VDAQAKEAAAAVEQLRRTVTFGPSNSACRSAQPALNDLIIVRTDLMVRLLPMREAMDHLTQRYHELPRRDR